MATLLPLPRGHSTAVPLHPPLADAATAGARQPGRLLAFACLRLRLRAWLLRRAHAGPHPVATLAARGEWASLDRLLDDLDRQPLSPPDAGADDVRGV